ncbi:MAG: aminoacyl-histidine dipeptidase [Chitinophagaceae bacterium]|nr:aminoacyl-histidine dipeptidase [Chitinophagaceae bacterium]MBK8605931.1 aminoacyl-histidine dipeptidase [Chitinophagaceae bacterium]MBP7109837.1 aminoacyl-histidine dipeptidase [Chitinophagaceae bacterium]HQX97209.1 aminoacyl-histidine dipeptidase [Chitinophagaceae bacterium]HQZ50503.1 aminoacyl-histidine dipeptidase [Chitinophagaceae bacterium]
MGEAIRQLEPKALWNHFADLNAVPRPSKKEERVIQFAKSFGKLLNLPTQVDAVGNVIIKKPASIGMENRQTVVLQSHLDMVHQKNADTTFDFDKQGIEMYIDGDWVKAKGTTLGADNGIGVAAIMALLASTDIEHPAIEALFTIDEETGMTGAKGLVGGLLNGTILLNLDTEDDDELTIGCAGGIDVTCTGEYSQEKPKGDLSLKISIKGLTGGHSGVDIQKGRANANKLMNRLLWELSKDFSIEIATIDGGSLRNAIPRESVAEIVLDKKKHNELKEAVTKFEKTIKAEHSFTDASLEVKLENTVAVRNVMNADFQYKFLRSMYACPNGIYRMTPEIEGLVQTSNNIAKVLVKEGKFSVQCLTRSSVDTEKTDLANAITSAFELIGASIEFGGNYPGWEPKPDAPIIKIMSELYEELFKGKAHVNAVHAGLECGIIGTNYPDMQMISFGPNIYGAHSPDERAQISSVQKFWIYLLATLKKIPVTE